LKQWQITYVSSRASKQALFLLRSSGSLCIFFAEGFPMKVRTIVFGSVLSLGLVTSGFLAGQGVSARRHPNLAAAQRLIDQAVARISAAQGANEFDMSGHAARAKDLLEQANREIKMAAETANRH
jgi:hypothetical protein